MKGFVVLLLAAAFAAINPAAADGDSVATEPHAALSTADALLARVRQSRPAGDLALKARLFVNRTDKVLVELLIHRQPSGLATLYRGAAIELLIIQPDDGPSRYYRTGSGELSGLSLFEPLFGSRFTPYDLGQPFLSWPGAELLEPQRQRGRTCEVVKVRNPDPEAPIAHVELWLDREYGAVLRADGFNEHGDRARQLAVTSFRRVDQVWIPRALSISFYPPGQALPAAEKSRLEIYDGDYEADLDPALFDPARF